MKNLNAYRLLIASLLALLALTAGAETITPTIQLTPEQRSRLLPQPQVQIKKPPRLPPMANLATTSLSIYQTPADSWCRNNPTGTATGRVFVQITFPRSTAMAAPYANLVVNTGAGEVRKRIRLGVDRFSASSDVLNFAAREFCADRCVSVRLEPEGTPSGYLVNTAARQACLP